LKAQVSPEKYEEGCAIQGRKNKAGQTSENRDTWPRYHSYLKHFGDVIRAGIFGIAITRLIAVALPPLLSAFFVFLFFSFASVRYVDVYTRRKWEIHMNN
jgi:hypothetical protein